MMMLLNFLLFVLSGEQYHQNPDMLMNVLP